MNKWNTLPESYQQRVHNNTLPTVMRQIQQAENPTPDVVISVEAARVDNAIRLDYLTSEVALEEPEIKCTNPNIPMDNNCTDDQFHLGMPGGSRDSEDDGDDSGVRDAIPTASQKRRTATEFERFDLGTSDVDKYDGEDGNDVNADQDEQASQADNGSTQNVED